MTSIAAPGLGAGPSAGGEAARGGPDHRRVRLVDTLPILSIHVIGLCAVFTGWSWPAVLAAVVLYWVRMFVITAFYHRYFSHRTFRAHRVTQFVFAFIGTCSAQRGPLWWAAHHRAHHRHSDDEPDPHSPSWKGVLWSHTVWFLTQKGQATDWDQLRDWKKYPELRWLERNHMLGPAMLMAALWGVGFLLARGWPDLRAGPWQMVAWGFGVSTTVLYHATFTVNSLAHVIGSQRFSTGDDSRNNWFIALITLGEGWHNNHHYYPGSVRQGFYWWEFDPTYWILRVMSWGGLVWNLQPVPTRVFEAAGRRQQTGRGRRVDRR